MITTLLLIFLALLLVFCNAFFVAAEFAMVKLRSTRVTALKKIHGFRGNILAYVHTNLDAYLSACQLGITLTSLGLGWIGKPAFAQLLQPLFEIIGITSPDIISLTSFLVAFSIISFLHIVMGELVPKSLAIRQPEKVSLWTAVPLFSFYWLMYPAIWILNFCANSILKFAKLDQVHKNEFTYSPDEIKLMLSATHAYGQLSKQELDILRHSIELLDLDADDVMRPIDAMIYLNANSIISQVLPYIIEHRYSRYPIYNEQTKEFIGIVHVKDILCAINQDKTEHTLTSIMRPVLTISRNLSAINLLNKLQEGMPHFALVCSSRENCIGFVTLDNIFQVLLGRVRDEFHKTDESWTEAADGSFIMSGNTALYVVERALKTDIELDPETERTSVTLFGLILTTLGRLPRENEKIDFHKFTLHVDKMKGHKITKVSVYPKLDDNSNA